MIKTFYQEMHDIISRSSALSYVYYEDKRYYPELYDNILKLHSVLEKYEQNRIALFAEKSFATYSGVYAILLSGNTWIPVNPMQPEDRNLHILELSEATTILCDRPLPDKLCVFAEEHGIQVVSIAEVLSSDNRAKLKLGSFRKDDIAYIMFTSGSTGIPKGVPMTHLNYINFVRNALAILPFAKHEIFSDYHDLGFDISIFYLFCVILTESALAPVLKDEERFFPLDNIISNKVTVWSSVPSALSRVMMLRPDDQISTAIRIMFLCGEPFNLNVLRYCYDNMQLQHVYNFYGLTETGVENFFHCCDRDDLTRYREKAFVPIGKLLPGNDMRITSDKELLLTGCQITPGYLGAIGKDRFQFIEGRRWYHTGDIVEYHEGVYFCKGRLDAQVKIHGYRVELMDIEVHIKVLPQVKEAVCFLDSEEHQRLVCALYLSAEINFAAISAHLLQRIPPYMIPKTFFVLPDVPTNQNGKIDRKAIKENYLYNG